VEPDPVNPNEDHGSEGSLDLTPSLVARLRGGDAQAGELLERFYRQAMIRFCWGYLGNLDEAEDAVQEVFCKILRDGQIPDRFRPWLYRIARNHCLNVLRGRARKKDNQTLPSDSQLDVNAPGNLTRLAQREMRSRVVQLVGDLPEGQREVLRLRYAEGLPRAEIAAVLELPESVVKSRLFEGLKKLRQHGSLLPGP
jgi:RNA polymerase sigma-70 factor (ECF subfamily)